MSQFMIPQRVGINARKCDLRIKEMKKRERIDVYHVFFLNTYLGIYIHVHKRTCIDTKIFIHGKIFHLELL